MLGSFLVALRVVLPMAITMGVGSLVRKAGVVKREDMGPLNKLIFKVLMPCLLFKNIYQIDFTANSYPKEIACIVAGIFAVFAFATVALFLKTFYEDSDSFFLSMFLFISMSVI